MATHSPESSTPEVLNFKGGPRLLVIGAVLAVVGFGAALALSGASGAVPSIRGFFFSYLAAYMFAVALGIGSLAFVLLQHLTRAGWSIGIRRTAENHAGILPVLAVLSLPLLATVVMGNGYVYRWALPMTRASDESVRAAEKNEAELEPVTLSQKEARGQAEWRPPIDPDHMSLDPLDLAKRSYGLHWLDPWCFIVRIILYMLCWSGIALWYRRMSIEQDRTNDPNLSLKMKVYAAPCLVVLGLTVTGAAFDLLMSLDPHWYSTMFGVIFIANSFLAAFATMIITAVLLQRAGYIRKTISLEHYHDLGKYLFAFTFFYGYVVFSQYMLIWYANIPEETEWMVRHGASTYNHNGYSIVILALLFGHILIPFGGLLSRHVKRNNFSLVFWAVWQLVFVALDMYWYAMPELNVSSSDYYGPTLMSGLMTALALLGFVGVIIASFGVLAARASLRPVHDPRLTESLAFQNI